MTKKGDRLSIRTRGVLPIQNLRRLADAGVISAPANWPIQDDQFQPNSMDLRLGEVAYRVRCSFLPENETVQSKLVKLTQHSFSIVDGAVLEPNCTYLIPLLERLDLPQSLSGFQQQLVPTQSESSPLLIVSEEHLSARTNPKSSTPEDNPLPT